MREQDPEGTDQRNCGAATQAHSPAAIDRGYLRRYFEDLELIAP